MQYIGIDIGTSSVCGVLYEVLTKQKRTVSKKNDSSLPSRFDGEKIQDPHRLMAIVNSIIDDLLADCSAPMGIGITGQMHGILYYDENGQAVSPLFTWQDGRGNLPDPDGQTIADFLTKKTGRFVATGYGLVTHYYNIIHRSVPEDAVGLCTIMDYVVMQLTGKKRAIIESSNAASIGFFDLEKNSFDLSSLSAITIDPFILPKLWRTDASPLYSSALAKRLNLKNSIPIFPAIGDNQAAFIGAVLSESSPEERSKVLSEAVHVTIGTSSQIAVYSSTFTTLPNLETRPFPQKGYLLVGAALCGGSSLALLKRFFEKTLKMFLPDNDLSENDFYRIMNSFNLQSPYSISRNSQNLNSDNDISNSNISNSNISNSNILHNHVVDHLSVNTCFSGTRKNPNKKGSINNITADNFVPEELIEGFYEGIVTELYEFWQNLPLELRQNRKFIAGSGNALRKNALLQKVLENKFNLPLKLSVCEEAALGAAEIAAFFRKQ